jgi:hypothetical protein
VDLQEMRIRGHIFRKERRKELNDYSIGSLEALAWTLRKLDSCKKLEDYKSLRFGIVSATQILVRGTARNFGDKLDIIEAQIESESQESEEEVEEVKTVE